jgi:hypothetical protein
MPDFEFNVENPLTSASAYTIGTIFWVISYTNTTGQHGFVFKETASHNTQTCLECARRVQIIFSLH